MRVLVVGGYNGTRKEAQLLIASHLEGEGGLSRWQELPPMHEQRIRPGMLQLGVDRVLVVGGESATAELLQLQRYGNTGGIWTLLTKPMTRELHATFLVSFNGRILAFGGFLFL